MRWDVFSFRSRTMYHGLLLSQVAFLAEAGDLEPRDLVRPTDGGKWRRLRTLLNSLPPARPHAATDEDESLEAGTDMTPMIDMTFLLLIFFMLTASFHIQKAIRLPTQDDGTRQPATVSQLSQTAVVVRIAADGSVVVLNEDGTATGPLQGESLVNELEAAARQRGTATLIVDAADEAAHESLVRVLDAAYQASLEDVRLTVPVATGSGGQSRSQEEASR